jgi:hypothetical protein
MPGVRIQGCFPGRLYGVRQSGLRLVGLRVGGNMQVQWINIERLVPYESNAKKHPDEQIGKIAASIEHFGWDQPIVADEQLEIIKGHGRYYAAKRLGRDKAPVVVRDDLSEEAKRAARLADNRTAESDWDWDLVSQELAELQELDLDVELTGFDAGEIEGLLQEPEIIHDDEVQGSQSGGHSPTGSVSFWIFDHKITDKRDETWRWVQDNLDRIREADQAKVADSILEALDAVLR